MKIHIVYDENVKEAEITVVCRELSDEVRRLLAAAEFSENKLTGVKDSQIFILRYNDIIYIDTADKHIFIYTSDDVYETQIRLYELERQLPASDFFRANKSCIVGIMHIRSIRADIDGRLLLTMDTGDKLWVSRQYAADFRKKIGM
ncbi:MAG: LytTR family DNA-binding domain-containing protein [Acutalibacteraceae bacterium]|nr:LytTR family DNA-binding domain-containing protein [Acutalibacteraceae bacterium]